MPSRIRHLEPQLTPEAQTLKCSQKSLGSSKTLVLKLSRLLHESEHKRRFQLLPSQPQKQANTLSDDSSVRCYVG
eukprot:1477694-Amphidinium_carterae.1